MSKTIGTFGYAIIKMKKSDSMPFDPIIHICLQQWSTTETGVPTITPDLMTEGEIDAHVKFLKEDLDNVGRKAKAALLSAKESTRKLMLDKRSS